MKIVNDLNHRPCFLDIVRARAEKMWMNSAHLDDDYDNIIIGFGLQRVFFFQSFVIIFLNAVPRPTDGRLYGRRLGKHTRIPNLYYNILYLYIRNQEMHLCAL